MDYENKYAGKEAASKGLAGTALGIGIGALGLEALRGGGLGGLFGGCNGCNGYNGGYSRYDAEKDATIARLEADKKLLESNIYTDSKITSVYEVLNNKIEAVKEELCTQRVFNANSNAAISCLNAQIAQLMALTKVVIPAANICPAPMPQYNSWTAPTAATTT